MFGDILDPFTTLAPNKYTDTTNSGAGLSILANNLIKFVIVIAGLYTFWNLIIAGYMFMSAGGDAKALGKAWEKIWQSLVGLLIVAGSFVLAGIFGYLIFDDPLALIRIRIYAP